MAHTTCKLKGKERGFMLIYGVHEDGLAQDIKVASSIGFPVLQFRMMDGVLDMGHRDNFSSAG